MEEPSEFTESLDQELHWDRSAVQELANTTRDIAEAPEKADDGGDQ